MRELIILVPMVVSLSLLSILINIAQMWFVYGLWPQDWGMYALTVVALMLVGGAMELVKQWAS